MPTYEYECTKCGKEFDYFQSIKEPAKDTCEACGGALIKLLSAGTGLIFKGSGFYITDYKGKSGSEGGARDSGGAKDSGGSKSESKSSDSGSGSGDSSKAGSSKSEGASKGGGESKSSDSASSSPSKPSGSGAAKSGD